MSRRSFLMLCSALATGQFLAPGLTWAYSDKLKNWAGNLEYGTGRLYSAKSTGQVQEFVRKHKRLKVLGTRHCFNAIADSRYQFISLKEMDQLVDLDPLAHTVTVESGVTYGRLCPLLDSKGWALHNLGILATYFDRRGLHDGDAWLW